MRRFAPVASMLLVLLMAVLGTVGTGMIYKALTLGSVMTFVMGLPLALLGLYWCGRALDQSLRAVREQRLRRT
jgi:hypothetical protein